jgi:hypothetical protein
MRREIDVPLLLLRTTADAARARRAREPITVGIPLPRAAVSGPDDLTLSSPDGAEHPLQVRVLDRWPDGSVRWALLDFQADADQDLTAYRVIAGRTPRLQANAFPSQLSARAGNGSLSVDAGAASFNLRAGGESLFECVTAGSPDAAGTSGSVVVTDASGGMHEARVDRVVLEEDGPLRTVARLEGVVPASAGSEPLLDLVMRMHFFAGLPTVRVALTLRNPRRAAHPGGLWDLGDEGSVLVKDVAVQLRMGEGSEAVIVRCSAEIGSPVQTVDAPVELYQDSSGGPNWRSSNHINRDRVVPVAFAGYRLRTAGGETSGQRATPIVAVQSGSRSLAVAVPEFWQNFPKAVEADARGITLRLFPHQSGSLHEIQGGEQKTHEFFVAFGHDGVSAPPLDWTRAPLFARAEPAWYGATGALPYLLPEDDDPNGDYRRLVRAAVEGADTFEHKREVLDEYGWRHFGEVYGDHEAVSHTGPAPLVSHYNNQYDTVAGLGYQFMRSGDPRWWALMHDLARHVVDIDIYHTDRDKSAYNHGLFWHTYHYIDADTATHRSYPAAAGLAGGGPSSEHNYATGLMLHYFLTGDQLSREAAIGLANFVIDIDDGAKTVFRWLMRGPTGLASASGSAAYHGPGRGGANSIGALLDGHQLTGERRFLDKAESLIRRSIHPADRIEDHDLLDAERKWFYTMFLQALGRYLDYKIALGELDRMYAYARESLLRYARWMVTNEYPYLDKPERLQYPTETWAAQDMRKSEVFKYAAKHASGAERATFWERAEFFFRYSTSTLTGKPTRTLARPVIVLLSHGFMHAYFERHPETTAPPPAWKGSFGSRQAFVPQKAVAMRRAKALAGAGVVAAVATVAAAMWLLVW